MSDNAGGAVERFSERVRPPNPKADAVGVVAEKIPLFPSREPQDYQAYACQRQGLPGPQMMLRLHAKNLVDSFAIEYSNQQSIEFRPGSGGSRLLIHYYSGEKITVEGRNLEPLYVALCEHRVVWLHAIDEFTAIGVGFANPDSPQFEAGKPLIFGIAIKFRDREEPLVLASSDPNRMACDQRPTVN